MIEGEEEEENGTCFLRLLKPYILQKKLSLCRAVEMGTHAWYTVQKKLGIGRVIHSEHETSQRIYLVN